MNRWKLSVILMLLMWVSAGCVSTIEKADSTPHPSHLVRILQKGELVVGTAGSMPPLNMTTKEGEIIGLEIDIAENIASGMGVQLRIEAMPFAELLPALESGKVDMILSGMTITPQRNLKVAFVGPYYVTGKAFLTKIERIASAQKASEVNSPDTTLTVLQGSTSQRFVEEFIPQAKLVPAIDYDEAVNLVIENKVDAMIADAPVCMLSVFRYPDKGLLSLFTPITYEPLGIALPGNDPLLVNWTDNFLNELKGSGKLEALKSYWFKHDSWLNKLP